MATLHSVSILRFFALAVAALLFGVAPAYAVTAAGDPMANARLVGEKRCGECHDTEKTLFGHTQHAQIFRGNPRNELEKSVCEACHGNGSLHAADTKDKTKIIGFSKEWGTTIERQNNQCLTCHSGGQRMHWAGSLHEKNKLACSDCHNPMARFSANGLLKKAGITETCQSCHQQQRAEFRKRSHMPVPEGKMTCVDCHNPHGSTSKVMLKADTVNDLCYSCHAEKRGPYIWEHAPVRQNCLACHNAHGSNQDKLLIAPRPMLCQQCHLSGHQMAFYSSADIVGASAGSIANRKVLANRSCQNCHSQIHGSNSPAGARYQR
jgi:DmsE family decaheme c-type cytochrome